MIMIFIMKTLDYMEQCEVFLSACGQTAFSRKDEQDKKAVCAMMNVIILSTLLWAPYKTLYIHYTVDTG